MNKSDLLLPQGNASPCVDDAHTVHVSAVKAIGLSTLLDRVDAILEDDVRAAFTCTDTSKRRKDMGPVVSRCSSYGGTRQYQTASHARSRGSGSMRRRMRKGREWSDEDRTNLLTSFVLHYINRGAVFQHVYISVT